jgi:hypothetical protein
MQLLVVVVIVLRLHSCSSVCRRVVVATHKTSLLFFVAPGSGKNGMMYVNADEYFGVISFPVTAGIVVFSRSVVEMQWTRSVSYFWFSFWHAGGVYLGARRACEQRRIPFLVSYHSVAKTWRFRDRSSRICMGRNALLDRVVGSHFFSLPDLATRPASSFSRGAGTAPG